MFLACGNELNLELPSSVVYPSDAAYVTDVYAATPPGFDSSAEVGPPTMFVAGQRNVTAIALDDDHVYWTTSVADGRVYACPKSGCGDFPSITEPRDRPGPIAVFQKRVFWTERASPDLHWCDYADGGCVPKTMDAKRASGGPIALDDAGVYVLDLENASDLTRCTYDGSCTKIPDVDGGGPTRVATGGGEVFFTDYTTGQVRRLSRATSAVSDLVTDPVPGVKSLAVTPSGDAIFFVNEKALRIERAARTKLSPQAAEIVLNARAELIAVDDERVYWTDTDGYLSTCRMEACTPVVLVTGYRIGALAVDSSGVWFSTLDDDALQRISP